jgi:AcrR family transcriptional regulator
MRARAASVAATRHRIVGVMIQACLHRWYDEVTLRDVAEGAGVSLQTVLNHFSSKEGLLEAMLQDPRTEREFGGKRLTLEPGSPSRTIRVLVEDYDHSGDAAIRLLALEGRVPSLAPVLAFGRAGHREWVERMFGPSLIGLDGTEHESRILQLVCVTDVYTWQILRRDQGLARRRVAAIMTGMVEAIVSSQPSRGRPRR